MADPISLGIQLAVVATNMALTASRKIEGPRLDSLKFSGGDPGAPWPVIVGRRRTFGLALWANDLREIKQERKTKGGKFSDYSYFEDAAYGIAGHRTDSVPRIWLDKKLVFDLTGPGPVSPFDFGGESGPAAIGSPAGVGLGGTAINSVMALYFGTEDQEPDPYMQSFIEAEHGEGWCPAYRNRTYVVFKNLPVQPFGNRPPVPEFEVISNAAAAAVSEDFDTTIGTNLFRTMRFSPDFSRLAWANGAGLEVWDVASRAPMGSATIGFAIDPDMIGVYNDGRVLAVSGGTDLVEITPDGIATSIFTFADQFGVYVLADANGHEHWGTIPYSFYGTWHFDGTEYYNGTWRPTHYFSDFYGDIWAVGVSPFGSSTIYFQRMVQCGEGPEDWPDLFSVSGLSAGDATFATHVHTNTDDVFVVWQNGVIYRIDPATGSVLTTASGPALSPYSVRAQWANIPPGSGSVWLADFEHSLLDGSQIRDIDVLGSGWRSIYDPISHALITDKGNSVDGTELRWVYIDRVGSAGPVLGDVCALIADRVGVTAYDFSDLDQEVIGWSLTQGPGTNALEPLLDAFDSDLRPHDFLLQGIKRNGASGGTLTTPWFVRESDSPRYAAKLRQAAELPQAVVYNFADIDKDQQPNNVRSARSSEATEAKGETSIDLTTFASDADTMRHLADRHFRRLWNERREVSLSLTAQQLALEPGDVRTLDLDGAVANYRLTRLTIRANDVLATEWKYDHGSLATLDDASGAALDGQSEDRIVIPGIAKGFVLDIPLLRDADNSANPLIYYAAAPYNAGLLFPGATVWQKVAGDYTEQLGGVDSASPATWGYANGVLPNADPWVWDRGSSVNVTVQNGSLAGCTEADIDANPFRNLALLGNEILNFTTATLEGDGTYTLSGFKRGRRGTEWACDDHAARDVFLALGTAQIEEMGLSEVGTDLAFKVATNGRTLDSAFPITMTPFTGATLKPYAPVHIAASKSGSDWVLTWVRRSRLGGAWTSGTTVPLSEASEAYEVDIMAGETVVRTITGLSSPSATYTAAMQTADFGGAQAAIKVRVYQISDAVGRGFGADFNNFPQSAQWRIEVPAVSSPGVTFREVEMRAEIGGEDQCIGGTASASFSNAAAAATFDDDVNNNGWANAGAATAAGWLQYTFPAPVAVAEVSIRVSNGGKPASIVVSYYNGSAWIEFMNHSGLSWAHNETKTFTL